MFEPCKEYHAKEQPTSDSSFCKNIGIQRPVETKMSFLLSAGNLSKQSNLLVSTFHILSTDRF